MEQYNTPTEGTVNLSKESPVTRTSTDRRFDALEAKIAEQGQELLKLRRDIGRLRGAIADIENEVNNINQRRGQT